jgi:hypothetical protein
VKEIYKQVKDPGERNEEIRRRCRMKEIRRRYRVKKVPIDFAEI